MARDKGTGLSTTQPPTISVALATCNGERYLRSQLQSLAEQTRLPDELVVMDDLSVDGTIAIVEDFGARAPFPVRWHINDKRMGWRKNFIAAAKRCSSDVIAFCDQDDIWMPAKLERVREYAQTMQWEALVHRSALFFTDRLEDRAIHLRHRATYPDSAPALGGFDGHRLVFKRNLLPWFDLQDQLEDTIYPGVIAHDRLVFLAATTVGRAVYIDEMLTLFRRHSTQFTADPERRFSGSSEYEQRAKVFAGWEAALRLHARDGLAEEPAMSHTIAVLSRLSQSYTKRSSLYCDSSMFQRVGTVLELCARGFYGPHSGGGLGIKPLLKDAFIAAFGAKAFPLGMNSRTYQR